MKKLLVLIACGTITAATLFAGAESEKTATGQNASADPISFTFAVLADVPPRADAPVLAALEKKYGFKMKYVNIERSQYNQMLGLKITSGETPNAFMLDGNMLQYAQFVEQGTLRSIPLDLLKKHAPTVYKMQEPYFKYMMIDGEIYGLTGEKATNDYPLNAIWRMDWLERVGITKVPETLAEAEKAFYAFRNGDPDGNGKKDTYALGKSGLDMIFGAYGGIPWGPWPQYSLWVKDGAGGIQHAAVLPQMKEALALLQKWYKDGLIDPEYVLGENKGGYWAISTDFLTGKIGFTGLGHYYHWVPDTLFPAYSGGPVFSEFKKLNPTARIAFGKAVSGPQGKAGTWLYPVGVGAAGMIVFGSETTDAQLIKLLQIHEGLCVSYDDYLLASYGFEGTHWYRDEASKAVLRKGDFIQRTKYLEEGIFILSTIQPFEFQKRDAPLMFDFAEKNYRFPGYRTELLVSPPSEKTVRPDLEKLRDQYYTEIISGVKPVSAFDDFVKSWNAMGGAKLKQEADGWYKSLK